MFFQSIYHSVIFSLIHNSWLFLLSFYLHAGVVEAKHSPGASSHTKLVFVGRARRTAAASRRKTRTKENILSALCHMLWCLVTELSVYSDNSIPHIMRQLRPDTVKVVLTRAYAYSDPLEFCIPFTSQCLLWDALEFLYEAHVQNHWESWPVNKFWEWNGQGCKGENVQKATKATYIALTFLQNSGIGTKWKMEIKRSWSNSS